MIKYSAFSLGIILVLLGCEGSETNQNDPMGIAANQEVASYLQSFEGRGDLADSSKPLKPRVAVESFVLPEDLSIDLVLAEPQIRQPLEITFDHRGRLWVVQYSQYPYPKGLKVTGIDNHLRAQFDKVPEPPPDGDRGADKIAFYEDTDGDGTYDQSTDAITGLNIATAVELGRGKIWVLNPPYLLAYPDLDDDGIPDASPEVHLRGFGLEDTHAVANSLRWGVDGWLYGATGSTVTSNISSKNTQSVSFKGQGIWRYHPEQEVFELFAEGGGNTFHVEIDSKGRIYSGDNGSTRGQYYKQGAYYGKNWGKHGPLTNSYAFGNLENMPLEGEPVRFTHAWIKYEGGALPSVYSNKMIAINPLQNYLQLTELVPRGSTFGTKDLSKLVTTEDHWFRPVDIKAGPDGAVYVADWYDSRLSHVDPRDDWHKNSGRIYRITGNDPKPLPSFDLSKYSSLQLIELLSHENKWFRQQALRILGDRKDPKVEGPLIQLLQNEKGQLALEALWGLNVSGLFNSAQAQRALTHQNPYVRMWAVRLLGDVGSIPGDTYPTLVEMAGKEQHPEVLSQLACSAKRLSGRQALPLIEQLLVKSGISTDPDNPLLLWWAIEAAMERNGKQVVSLFKNQELWNLQIVQEMILPRVSQKLIMIGTNESFTNCTDLLAFAPDTPNLVKPVINGIQEGMRINAQNSLPDDLTSQMNKYLGEMGQAPLTFKIQRKEPGALKEVLDVIQNTKAPVNDRLTYIEIFGKLKIADGIPKLMKLVSNQGEKTSIRKASLDALAHYDNQDIGENVAKMYPDRLRSDPALRTSSLDLFSTRATWAKSFLLLIDRAKQVDPADVPIPVVRQFQLLDDHQVNRLVSEIWPNIETDHQDKTKSIERVVSVLGNGTPNLSNGRLQFLKNCGACHKLNREGGNFGPDLTGYDRSNLQYMATSIIDPSVDVREGYVNFKLTTQDGRNIVGIITSRTSEMVALKTYGGTEHTIPFEQVKLLEAQPVSIMPDRLVDDLTDTELRNLFAYIMQRQFAVAN